MKLLSVVWLLGLLSTTPLYAQTKSQIRKSWKQLAVKSIRYRCEQTERQLDEGTQVEKAIQCTYSRGKYEIEFQVKAADPSLYTIQQRTVFDGHELRLLDTSQNIGDGAKQNSGEVLTGTLIRNNAVAINLSDFFPVLLTHFPAEALSKKAIDFDQFHIHQETKFIDGIECVCLTWGIPDDGAVLTNLYLDPQSDFAIRAIEQKIGKLTASRLTLDVTRVNDRFQLDRFTSKTYDLAGALVSESIVTTLDGEILDSVPANTFRLDFPPGIAVDEIKAAGNQVRWRTTPDDLKPWADEDTVE